MNPTDERFPRRVAQLVKHAGGAYTEAEARRIVEASVSWSDTIDRATLDREAHRGDKSDHRSRRLRREARAAEAIGWRAPCSVPA
jgi:hypothetical protein